MQRVFLLAIGAGMIGGALMAGINFAIVQVKQNQIADLYSDELVAQGIIDEDEFNLKLQELQLQNILLPFAIGIGGGVLVAVLYLRIDKGAFKVALAVAAAAWVALYAMPTAKYPADPDTVFNPEGDGGYSILYACYAAASGFTALGSALAFSKTHRRNWYFGAAGLYIGILGVLFFAFPSVSVVEFVPQQLLNAWRSSMSAGMTALWFSLGIISGALLQREEKKGHGREISST